MIELCLGCSFAEPTRTPRRLGAFADAMGVVGACGTGVRFDTARGAEELLGDRLPDTNSESHMAPPALRAASNRCLGVARPGVDGVEFTTGGVGLLLGTSNGSAERAPAGIGVARPSAGSVDLRDEHRSSDGVRSDRDGRFACSKASLATSDPHSVSNGDVDNVKCARIGSEDLCGERSPVGDSICGTDCVERRRRGARGGAVETGRTTSARDGGVTGTFGNVVGTTWAGNS